jgi:NAD(P)-dependent dehydrogenase (short-subunit alcohol dehydrogenase family)
LPEETLSSEKSPLAWDCAKLFDLLDKVAIVTGATGSLGNTLALGLASLGARVVPSGRNVEKLKLLAKKIEEERGKGSTLPVQADVTKESDVEKLVEETVSKFGQIDILVACSGSNILRPAAEYQVNDFRMLMDINALGTFICDKQVGKKMIEQKHGKIVNVSSIRGWFATSANAVAYSASKAAINMITRSLACEWARHNVHVNAIAPAMVGGGMHMSGPDGKAHAIDPKILEGIAKRTPMKRLATPEDLIGPVAFLASDASNFITGQIIYVDGGASVWAA